MATPSSPPLSRITLPSRRLRFGQKSRPLDSSRKRTPILPLLVIRLLRITLSVSQWPIETPSAVGVDRVALGQPYLTPQHQNRPRLLRLDAVVANQRPLGAGAGVHAEVRVVVQWQSSITTSWQTWKLIPSPL